MRSIPLIRRLACQEHTTPTRELRALVLRHALATGRPLSVDALDVTLAVAQRRRGPCHWTADTILTFAFVDVLEWCAERDLDAPPGVLDALGLLLDTLHQEHRLAAGSSGITALRAALRSVGAGLGGTRRSAHPAQSQRASVVRLPEPAPAG